MLNEYVKINHSFNKSINLQLDLNDEQKIRSFIPTASTNEMLRYYIGLLTNNSIDRANILLGAYGKGKSHIVLVLLYLISKGRKNGTVKQILEKIKNIDTETHELLKEFVSSKKYYLPVIISSTRNDLNQSLLVSLKRSLVQNDIEINLDTDFEGALERIELWKNDYRSTYDKFVLELRNKHLGVKTFIADLKSYDGGSLDVFKDIHKSILSGAEFKHDQVGEIIDYYEKVNRYLCDRLGYSGIYLVFDEFSKFIESRDESNVTNDMKIIQDLCEIANNSKPGQEINVLLIMHKHIMEYSNRVSNKVKNAFRGIEGRVVEKNYQTNLKNNYDLITNVVSKNRNTFENMVAANRAEFERIAGLSMKLNAFNSYFTADELMNTVIKGCFPLNPITTYLLLNINEKVAQNERTLFTFLAKDDENTLVKFIDNNDSMMNPAYIYDYFKSLFSQEKDDVKIISNFHKLRAILPKIDSTLKQEIVKTMALIKMVNKPNEILANVFTLSIALNKSMEDINAAINELKKLLLVIEKKNGELDFKQNIDFDLRKIVNKELALEKDARDPALINFLNENKYEIPKYYNSLNKITRYYYQIYIDINDFLSITNFLDYIGDNFADGYILNVLSTKEADVDKLVAKTQEIGRSNVVILYNLYAKEIYQIIKELNVVNRLLNDEKFEEGLEAITELQEYGEELKIELFASLNEDFNPVSSKCQVVINGGYRELVGSRSWNRLLSNQLSEVYNLMPIINLELINKSAVTGVYAKATQSVVQDILDSNIRFDPKKTSPEDTIVRNVLKATGIMENNPVENMELVFSEIKDYIYQCKNEANAVVALYDNLQSDPYGLRKGVIPILFSYVIKDFKEGLIIYNNNLEVPLNSETIMRINNEPGNYSLLLEQKDPELSVFLDNLSELFDCKNPSYSEITSQMIAWYNGLPMLAKTLMSDQSQGSRSAKKLKNKLNSYNLNSRDFIVEHLKTIFSSNDYHDIYSRLEELKIFYDGYGNTVKNDLKLFVVEALGYNNRNSLVPSLNDWYIKSKDVINSKVLEQVESKFVNILENLDNDEDKIFEQILFEFTGLFFDNWAQNTVDIFKTEFQKTIRNFSNRDNESNKILIKDGNGVIERYFDDNLDESVQLVENVINEAFEDFGDSLSNEQKVALLVKLIKDIGN